MLLLSEVSEFVLLIYNFQGLILHIGEHGEQSALSELITALQSDKEQRCVSYISFVTLYVYCLSSTVHAPCISSTLLSHFSHFNILIFYVETGLVCKHPWPLCHKHSKNWMWPVKDLPVCSLTMCTILKRSSKMSFEMFEAFQSLWQTSHRASDPFDAAR